MSPEVIIEQTEEANQQQKAISSQNDEKEIVSDDLVVSQNFTTDVNLDSSYNFDAFISKMRDESCKPVLENIKRFIKVFLDKLPSSGMEDMVQAYRSFYSTIKVKCLQAKIWSASEGLTTDSERANALEGLESLIMNQLHDRVMSFDASERDLDDFMERKMALHAGWIQMEHLDVPDGIISKLKNSQDNKHNNEVEAKNNQDSWLSIVATEFQKMSVYRTPRDKLVCALNGCKILNSLTVESNADDFLPLLIYTLIRANPPQLYSNINYIARFRAPERISGETAYCFTHLMAAAEFIEKMDGSALKIESEAYESFMEASIEEFNGRMKGEEETSSPSTSFNEKMDLAEAKAEEFFLKAKEAFKVTGEKANQALSNFKESSLAKRSLEKINSFMKDLGNTNIDNDNANNSDAKTGNNDDIVGSEEEFQIHLARAISMSLGDESANLITSEPESMSTDAVIDDNEVNPNRKTSCDESE